MINTILKAGENFCIHQIRLPYEVSDTINKTRTLIAFIDIDTNNGEKHRVYIASEPGFVQRVSKLFLEEDESDEETLIDMALETVNLIVGSAKVLAQETNETPFTIGTPVYDKQDTFNHDFDEAKVIKVENDTMILAIKVING
ncbi:MAG: chemotaxis protein CheX [Helicobacteraceae bacterium]|nr:chemotaxis protein CheX [Helicobacteraceae bacterium]